MSKSDPSDASRINLTDDADTTMPRKSAKPRQIADAPLPIDGLKDRPEARNLVNIFCALNDQSVEQCSGRRGGHNWHIQARAGRTGPYRKWARSPSEMSRLDRADTAEIDRILRATARPKHARCICTDSSRIDLAKSWAGRLKTRGRTLTPLSIAPLIKGSRLAAPALHPSQNTSSPHTAPRLRPPMTIRFAWAALTRNLGDHHDDRLFPMDERCFWHAGGTSFPCLWALGACLWPRACPKTPNQTPPWQT